MTPEPIDLEKRSHDFAAAIHAAIGADPQPDDFYSHPYEVTLVINGKQLSFAQFVERFAERIREER